MSLLLNQRVQDFACPFDDFQCSTSEQRNSWLSSFETDNTNLIIMNPSHVSNLSSLCEIILPNSQTPAIRTFIAPTESINPENESTPIEIPKAQRHGESKHIQHNITNRFRFVYRQFHQLLWHLVATPSKFQAASSLQAIFTLQTAKNWFSHLPLTGGMVPMPDDDFNDRIFGFLQRNWTVSPWFRDFIQSIVDRKLDADLPTYFTNLDPLWDLWDESQRAKELNSQLLAEPSLFAAIYHCCGGKKRQIGKPYKRTLRTRDTTLGADPLAIWENAMIDPLPMSRKRVRTSDNRPIYLSQSSFSAKASEDRVLLATDIDDMLLPASPASSSGSTVTAVRCSDLLSEENPANEGDISFSGCIEVVDPDRWNSTDAPSAMDITTPQKSIGFVEGLSDPAFDSKFSDVWLVEAFTPASELPCNFGPRKSSTPTRTVMVDEVANQG
ncbi:hypothetical protein AOL_s00043g700 [Orbilia oligospora ATCC 24927]|uniref:Uncharacterized protein n=1 Tax=Arthrobotrys oligospora (strain ATCC 24927 / CBS 115.81 / DSM 1491) TaxID=756982 RepID=G1X4S6_ARTOA|nr:hypothetical protein AOL_s00043g700 [Orbilia oligospora ATCC 24927]EGX51966.1 hypothetical protein AOL_s00043g700 [Orbilia oligospora ATCC 24927]